MNSISVIIPTYNRCEKIVAAIGSVMNQSQSVKEIIVCDDGSIDNTHKVVKKLSIPYLKYLAIPHTGLPAVVRNHGIRAAKGEYAAFLDSDDVWEPSKLSRQIDFMSKEGFDISCTNAKVTGRINDVKMHRHLPKVLNYASLSETNYVICSSLIVKRSLLEAVSFFPENVHYRAFEDWVLWMRLSTATDIGVIDEPLLTYTDNPNQSIRSGLSLEKSLLQTIRRDVITWGFKHILTHPSKVRLLKAMKLAYSY